ncbi:MAG: transposase [Alistipes sp.]|nr:transposase [Alistipes sp.]
MRAPTSYARYSRPFRYGHSSNGPTKAINSRIETLRGNAMGFSNIANYI